MSNTLPRFVAVLVAVGLTGCGSSPEVGTVSGKVTYNGAPLNHLDGKIIFIGPEGKDVAADIGTDGSYQAAGVSYGENKVAVSYPNPNAPRAKSKKRIPSATPAPSGPVNTQPFLTPTAYADPHLSKLTVTVQKETTYNPNLVGPPIK